MRLGNTAAIVALVGCGGSGDAFCVEDQVTISQGLYGRVMREQSIATNEPPTPVGQAMISILDAPDGQELARATSNDSGVYQAELDTGAFSLCTPQEGCVSFTIAPSTRARADLHEAFAAYWELAPASDCAR